MTSPPSHNSDLPVYAVEVNNISKIYHTPSKKMQKKVLTDMTLAVPRGSIFGLLGPNGAGKSTLINILAGTVIKTTGTAKIWGTDIDENPRQARANIGVVPQELHIDTYFTPRETLEFMAGMFAVPKAKRRTDAILKELGLADKASAYTRTLSGGMRRRLLVAKAMVHQPPVLVLDEPSAGVDVALRQRLWNMIRQLNKKGVTIILTTHYLEEAEALCDRVAIINRGHLLREASTRDLLAGADAKNITLKLESPIKAVPKTLADLNASVIDGGLSVNYSPKSTTAGMVISRVNEAGLVITDVSTSEPDLEDVFLSMTSSGDGDGA